MFAGTTERMTRVFRIKSFFTALSTNISINYTERAVCPSLREPIRTEWRSTNLFWVSIRRQTTTTLSVGRETDTRVLKSWSWMKLKIGLTPRVNTRTHGHRVASTGVRWEGLVGWMWEKEKLGGFFFLIISFRYSAVLVLMIAELSFRFSPSLVLMIAALRPRFSDSLVSILPGSVFWEEKKILLFFLFFLSFRKKIRM